MKKPIVIILLFFSFFSFAQQEKITKLLNRQFEKEQKMYDREDTEKPTLVQPFQIKNDTLSFEFSIQPEPAEIEFIRREVHLTDIEEFIKDMNVLFITKSESVKEIRAIKTLKGETLKVQTTYSHLFFTELRKDYKDENSLRTSILKSFQKAGYNITGEYWFN